jgi:putative tryptophan/tyrosine transport system substrate-binding protein
LTGFSFAEPDIAGKQLDLLKEMIPSLKRVVILWTSSNPYSVLQWKAVEQTAAKLGVTVVSQEAQTLQEIENVLATLTRSSADAVMVLDDPLVFTYRKKIVEAVFRARLPSSFGLREFVNDGGLMSYGADIADTYRRAAIYVDKIFRGEKPADLPIQLPTKFDLVINLKMAKGIGIAVPPTLLARADEVIE